MGFLRKEPRGHLISMPLALSLAAASHDGEDVDVAVEACCRQHRGIPGTPLDVEAPLAAGGQLIQHLWRQRDLKALEELNVCFYSGLAF